MFKFDCRKRALGVFIERRLGRMLRWIDVE
jgi:hypothetical protein